MAEELHNTHYNEEEKRIIKEHFLEGNAVWKDGWQNFKDGDLLKILEVDNSDFDFNFFGMRGDSSTIRQILRMDNEYN